MVRWSLIKFSFFYPAEKRALKKPERFSSGLPNSQELMEIRTKKKVSGIDWSRFVVTLHINSQMLNSNTTYSSCFLSVQLLITGTEQFNLKPKKGIQFLQEKGLLSNPMDNNQVAQWLRENPRLDKKMIGEYISDRKNTELLDSFVK